MPHTACSPPGGEAVPFPAAHSEPQPGWDRDSGTRAGQCGVFGHSEGSGKASWVGSVPHPAPHTLQIHFWEEQRQNESARVKTLFLPETGVKLKNLTGYTSYWVSVAAFNAAGDGPRSPPVKARTQQAGEARGTAPPAPPAPGLPGEVSPWVRLQGFPLIPRSRAEHPWAHPGGFVGWGHTGMKV